MTASDIATDFHTLRIAAREFQEALPRVATLQLLTTFVPLLLLLAVMHAALSYGWLPALVLGLPAAGLVVRVFALQHDCGHGSLFRSRVVNDIVGRFCSLFTFTPYSHWRRQHAQHHAVWNDLDHRDRGADIYSTCTTLAEYRAMSRRQKLRHRVIHHPVVTQLLLPPLVFLALYRFPFDAPAHWRRERRGVHLTNLALLIVYGTLSALVGLGQVALVLGAVMLPASIIGGGFSRFSIASRVSNGSDMKHGTPSPRRLRGVRSCIFRGSCVGLRGGSGFTTSITWHRVFRTTVLRHATTRIQRSPPRAC